MDFTFYSVTAKRLELARNAALKQVPQERRRRDCFGCR